MRRLRIAPDVDAWREAARELLHDGVPPEEVEWVAEEPGAQASLFAVPAPRPTAPPRSDFFAMPQRAPAPPAAPAGEPPRVPRSFVERATLAARHREPLRWTLLYRLLWRLTRGEPRLLEVATDPDVRHLELLVRQVRRDAHAMRAFVRFRRVDGPDGERWVAWHRPDHHVVPLVAPFFVERFGPMRWALLTPQESALWDGGRLALGPGCDDPALGGDDAEALWRSYYRSTFNPARLNLRATLRELPARHWATLPETREIPALLDAAGGRVGAMLAAPARPPAAAWLPPEPFDLPALAAAARECTACALAGCGSRVVFGEGPTAARLVVVGEQPGDVEDRLGRPFVGPAGDELAAALAAAGLARDELYLTNAVKHFKFEERGARRIHKTPSATEVSSCWPWLEAELKLVQAPAVVCLGATAARAVLGPAVRLTRDRGVTLRSRDGRPGIATWHPAAILRAPDERRPALREQLVADLAAARSLADGAAAVTPPCDPRPRDGRPAAPPH